VHQFGVLVSNKDGVWLSDSSPTLTMALPTRLIVGEYHVRSGYGKIMSDNNSYMIGLYKPSFPLIRSSQIVCQERKTGKNINIFKSDDDDYFTYITLSNNDKYLSAISSDSIIYTWDILSGQRISKQKLAYSIDKVIPGAFASVSPYDPSIVAMIADSGRFIAYSQSFTTSINQETLPTQEIESYPQPIHVNDGYFFMKVPMAEIESITAISVLGEIVPLEFVHTDASTFRIMLPSLSRGHYTVQIKTQSGQALVHSILIL
jgi:WD40 repeat protein